MGSYGRKYSREERARMIQAEGDGLADQFRERIVALEADAVYAGRAIEHYQSEVLRVEADLAAARAERDAIQHDLDAHLGNGAPAHECLVDKYRAACKDLNIQLANADEANEKYRIALAAADATCEWREDKDGIWFTACDNAHQFIVDGPSENEYKFCPYCGKHLHAVPFVEMQETEE